MRDMSTETSTAGGTGRINQKHRTRQAILAAAREAIIEGGEVTMPDVARRALVSEATAYRYFPDLGSLLREVLSEVWDSPDVTMAAIADNQDPVERIGFATEALLREVLAHQTAVRAMIATSITKPQLTGLRPARRLGLIDVALRPVTGLEPARLEQLKLSLAIVVSAEALFTLLDLCDLAPDDAVATAVATARTLTSTALSRAEQQ
jgi:AcrR family transcriptional regulator